MKLNSRHLKLFSENLSETEVGGKFQKQSVMARSGLVIPPFFCLTGEVFKVLVAHLQQDFKRVLWETDWSSDQSIKEASQKLHSLIAALSFPETFSAMIYQKFDELFKPHTLVSVRSSMISDNKDHSEDSLLHAFAGMSESFLYVKRESLLSRIKDCFASGFSPQVLTYRHTQGIDLFDFTVAVGVQEMILAEKSFVMFTCDPNTLEKKTLVVAGLGVGEGVVQEKVETDHYFVHPKNKSIQKKIALKESFLTHNDVAGEGILEKPTPKELQSLPVLTDAQLLALSEMGKKVEKIFGAPQDIEGCLVGEKIYLLQSRPIQFSEHSVIVWTSANVSESFPGTTTPLTFSFAQDFYRIIFIDCYRALGVPEKVIMQNIEHLDHMVGFLHGKIYYNLSSFYRLHSLSPLFIFFKKQWEDMMGFSGSFHIDQGQGHFKKFIKGLSSIRYTLFGLALISWRYLTNQRDVNRFLLWWEERFKTLRARDFNELSSFECMTLYRELWQEVGVKWWITLLNDTHLPTAYHVTEFLMKSWKLQDSQLMSNLLCGGHNFKSVEIMYNGVSLSEFVKKDPTLLALFQTEDQASIWESIQHNKAYSHLKEKMDHHLYHFGDRGLQELKLEQKGLRDDPVQLIQIIKNYLAQNLSVENILQQEQERRRQGEATLAQKLRFSPFKRAILRFQFWRLRGFIQNREDTRYCRSELFGFSKRIFYRIARQFKATGLIQKEDDIFFLHVDEVFGLIEGASLQSSVRDLIALRRREYLENEKIDLPMDITTNGALFQQVLIKPEIQEDATTLTGLGSSPGIVRGRARIVLDPQKVEKMYEGDILIAKETDPGWLFLMLASKGMVVERGSMLSHTAITGRKFGIPTIVAVPGVTQKIKEGQMIEIDGGLGIIRIIE